MKKQNVPALLLSVILISLSLANNDTSFAGDDGTAGSAAAYLREGLGARAMGMGNAATAASEGADGVYWNPAALVGLAGSSLATQTSVLGLGRSWNFLNFCQPFTAEGARMAVGFSLISFSSGADIEARSANQVEPERTFSDTETAFVISGAYELEQNFALGVNAKLLNHQLDDSNAKGPGFDASLWHSLGEEYCWGLVVQDLYSRLVWSERYSERLPILARLGAKGLFFDKTLLMAADFALEYAVPVRAIRGVGYRVGAEYKLLERLSLRAGWDTDRWTAGVGWSFFLSETKVHLDYALAGERFPGAGLPHLFSLRMDFGPVVLAESESNEEKMELPSRQAQDSEF